MGQAAAVMAGVSLLVSDVSGQKTVRASKVPASSTVGELVQGLLARLGLPRNDTAGRPLTFRARLEREARHLNGSELVGDALQEDDHIVLQPNIDAGGRG